jgi:hypothetical protein
VVLREHFLAPRHWRTCGRKLQWRCVGCGGEGSFSPDIMRWRLIGQLLLCFRNLSDSCHILP